MELFSSGCLMWLQILLLWILYWGPIQFHLQDPTTQGSTFGLLIACNPMLKADCGSCGKTAPANLKHVRPNTPKVVKAAA